MFWNVFKNLLRISRIRGNTKVIARLVGARNTELFEQQLKAQKGYWRISAKHLAVSSLLLHYMIMNSEEGLKNLTRKPETAADEFFISHHAMNIHQDAENFDKITVASDSISTKSDIDIHVL